MFTVFANMLINSEEKLEHLKDSFFSFKNTSDDWVINIRGSHREEAIRFLREQLGGKARFFSYLNDSRGWMRNADDLLREARHHYVLVWNEDHIHVAPAGYLQNVVEEMNARDADYLMYSWWQDGKLSKQFDVIPRDCGTHIDCLMLDAAGLRKVIAAGREPYLVSLIAIFKKDFLHRLLTHDAFMFPLGFTHFIYKVTGFINRFGAGLNQKAWFDRLNRLLYFKLRRQPKVTPHDVEKRQDRFDILPIRMAFPHQELFACTEDDGDTEHPYSLVRRGLYPTRDVLVAWDPAQKIEKNTKEVLTLRKGDTYRKRYCFYIFNKGIRQRVAREYVEVRKGNVRVTVADEVLELRAGQGAAFYTNLTHTIEALEDCELVRHIADFGVAPRYFPA